uniref:Uncharacterized protein n=1 Tax=Heterorhabditis bacteriophora TaxID=37862 RepID=A0A1I7X0Y9_HETBA
MSQLELSETTNNSRKAARWIPRLNDGQW